MAGRDVNSDFFFFEEEGIPVPVSPPAAGTLGRPWMGNLSSLLFTQCMSSASGSEVLSELPCALPYRSRLAMGRAAVPFGPPLPLAGLNDHYHACFPLTSAGMELGTRGR